MRKAIFAILFLLAGGQAMAEGKLTCAVSKFPAGEHFFDLTDDKLLAFTGDVESGQALLVDSEGSATVKSEIDSQDAEKYNIYGVYDLLNLVIVSEAKSGTSAMGNKGAILVDSPKGLAISCGLKGKVD